MNNVILLDNEAMKDDEREALEHVKTIQPCLERAMADIKIAPTLKGKFDGEISAVCVVYHRAIWWLNKALEIPANQKVDRT